MGVKVAKEPRSNNMNLRGLNGIIPLTMKIISDDMKSVEILIAHLDASRISVGVLDGSDHQSRLSGGVRNQLNDGCQGGQWLGSPVDRNERKEAMFDLIPFARSWREMADRD